MPHSKHPPLDTASVLSPIEAAEQYAGGCHPRTLKRWAAEGKFPTSIRLSNRRFAYRRSDLERWLAALGNPLTPDQEAA